MGVASGTLCPDSLLTLHCLFHVFDQAEAPPPQHSVWLWSLDFLDHEDISSGHWHLSSVEFELRMWVQLHVCTWLIASQDKVWVRGGTAVTPVYVPSLLLQCHCLELLWWAIHQQHHMLYSVKSHVEPEKRLLSFSDLVVTDDTSSENEIIASC